MSHVCSILNLVLVGEHFCRAEKQKEYQVRIPQAANKFIQLIQLILHFFSINKYQMFPKLIPFTYKRFN